LAGVVLAAVMGPTTPVLASAGSSNDVHLRDAPPSFDYDARSTSTTHPTNPPIETLVAEHVAAGARRPSTSLRSRSRAAKGGESIDPALVRFSQDSIKGTFKNGGSVDDLAAGLKSGAIKPGDVPPIRVVERDGNLFTLDNRRLEAFRRTGVPIRYRYASPEEAANEAFKFTTRNGGQSVRVRGG
jgi:hypothetical protein